MVTPSSQTDDPIPHVVLPGTAELRWMGTTGTQFLATGASTGGGFCLVDEQAVEGEEVPLHRHPDDVESFYVLDGEIEFYLGDAPAVRAGTGSFAHVPAGAVHGFRITSPTARYLILTTPHHGEFYRAISEPSGPDRSPPGTPVDMDAVLATAERFGIEFIGPLPAG